MPYTDKTITCTNCGSAFTFTAGEQDFHAQKGFTSEPRRCPTCRGARRESRDGGGSGGYREMFSATCATCGKEARVPFEPRNDRPVYCSDCFRPQPRDARGSYAGRSAGGRW